MAKKQNKTNPIEPTLLDETMRLIAARIEAGKANGVSTLTTIKTLSQEASVNWEWARKLCRNSIDDPGIRKIQALHDSLTGVVREDRP